MGLFIDAVSVHAAVTATFVKTPAEKSLLCHALFLREMLGRKTLNSLIWIDTRDMVSDGLTKEQFRVKAYMKLWTDVCTSGNSFTNGAVKQ